MTGDSPALQGSPASTGTSDARAQSSADSAASNQPGPALFVRLARFSDMVVALAALIAAFVLTNVGRMPQGFTDFLALRLTVKNLVLLLAFAVFWRVICT